MKLLQVNTVVNSGSTGRIAEDIGQVMLANGHESYIAYGRGDRPSQSQLLRIGRQYDVYLHGIKSLLFDRHGFGSRKPTERLIREIERIRPDAIGLHNLHGYYLHVGVLFEYLRRSGIPVLWTLFDCWAFTGHCSYFDDVQCEKWQTHCQRCPKSSQYPQAYADNSFRNFADKKRLFTGLDNLELIVHSHWLADLVRKSFLKAYPVHVSPSGINLQVFKPTDSDLRVRYGLQDKKVILGCASIWSERKGYKDFIALRQLLDDSWQIVLIGLNRKEIAQLPKGILGMERTESTEELARWYSIADVFVNPTYQDNFPTTNLEALACGTPVVTYNTGGSPEAIDEQTGRVVNKGDIKGLVNILEQLVRLDKTKVSAACRNRAVLKFNKEDRYKDYLRLYEKLTNR